MPRPRISVYIATSVDGYIATDDDSLDWLTSQGAEGEDYGFEAFLADIDLVAMGRSTYEFIKDEPVLPYGSRPVHVFTTGEPGTRAGFSFYASTPAQAVQRWESDGFRHVYIDGGSLISQFLEAGLVDDLVVTIAPVLLGSGKPLFHRIATSTGLRLTRADPYASGMVQLRYDCVR